MAGNRAPQPPVFTWEGQDRCRAGGVDMDFKDYKSSFVAEGWLAAEGSLLKLLKELRAWFPFNLALWFLALAWEEEGADG